jgi:Protein of unknown function (DUF3054)
MTTDTSQEETVARALPPQRSFPWRATAIVVGDTAAFLLFAAVGRRTHNEASGIAAIGQIASTSLPFALGWFAVSPFVGAFRSRLTRGPWQMLARTELSWLAAWPVALLLRWAIAPEHNVPVAFAVVILLANAIILGLWRTGFALGEKLLTARRRR